MNQINHLLHTWVHLPFWSITICF